MLKTIHYIERDNLDGDRTYTIGQERPSSRKKTLEAVWYLDRIATILLAAPFEVSLPGILIRIFYLIKKCSLFRANLVYPGHPQHGLPRG